MRGAGSTARCGLEGSGWVLENVEPREGGQCSVCCGDKVKDAAIVDLRDKRNVEEEEEGDWVVEFSTDEYLEMNLDDILTLR